MRARLVIVLFACALGGAALACAALGALPVHAAPDPRLTARWDRPGAATVSWAQQARGCLYRNQTFVGCYDGAGRVLVTFGHVGPLSGDLRPTAGDVWVAVVDGVTHRAPLRSVQLLPVFRA